MLLVRPAACVLFLATATVQSSGAERSGGVKMQIIRGRPVVGGVYVNGHGPFRFVVDTATSSNHIERGLARKIGLNATFRTELTSPIGMVEAKGTDGVEVALGPVRAEGQEFLFAGMDVVHELSHDIQGILGQEFLSKFDYLLDVRAGRLEFGDLESAGNATRVPFRNLHGWLVVRTSLGELAVDSGVDWVTLFGVEGSDSGRRIVTFSGSADVEKVFSSLRIEGRTVWAGEAVALPRAAQNEVAGLLPISVFRAVYVSNSGGYLIFK